MEANQDMHKLKQNIPSLTGAAGYSKNITYRFIEIRVNVLIIFPQSLKPDFFCFVGILQFMPIKLSVNSNHLNFRMCYTQEIQILKCYKWL